MAAPDPAPDPAPALGSDLGSPLDVDRVRGWFPALWSGPGAGEARSTGPAGRWCRAGWPTPWPTR
ncbi:hypothetical protein [Nocardioides marinisabuli]|uniref:hypothetical protein n=1 Tax=Nocardioides marinisabuli TaxID=419476 RepID=UPI002155F12B|nr:hypothetical protein [Nocardioides marinisabuli]